MKNDMKKNEEAVSPVIATILMVAITVVLAGVLYVWANSLANDQPDTGTRNNFQASDASAAMTSGKEDTLLRVAWTNAQDDLNWAFVTFNLEVGDNVYSCKVSGGDCGFNQDSGDDTTKWEHDEIIFVTETGENICGGGSDASCAVKISVAYNGIAVAGSPNANVV